MKHLKAPLLLPGLAFLFILASGTAPGADQDNPKGRQQRNQRPTPGGQPGRYGTTPGSGTTPGGQRGGVAPDHSGNAAHTSPSPKPDTTTKPTPSNPASPTPKAPSLSETPNNRTPSLQARPTANGGLEKVAPSGAVRERVQQKPNGDQQVQKISPTGRVEKEVVQKRDGTTQSTTYDLGRPKKVETVHSNGIRETTDVHYNRDGQVRARETVKVDPNGTAVSKTVQVKNNLVIHNSSTTVINRNTTVIINNGTVVREYRPCRFGFVYAPLVVAPAFYVGWYDPFWYTPAGFAITTHAFTFSWGWYADPWYVYHRAYWEPYPVYVGPSYWVTDWMVAGYLADRYAVAVSAEQTRQEAELARQDAEKARAAAQQAKDEAEIAEAKAAQAAAEARAERAEARAAKAELAEAHRKELAGKPNPKETPIDKDTKEALKNQIDKTISEKKAFAEEQAKGGNPVLPDVSQALGDPTHIYPVSKNISVITKDDKPAGTLTPGDLLKAEPGQNVKDAKETDFVTMRVMTSKGEEDEVAAGTLIKVSLHDLQEFDNEFRAKLDLGLAEAEKNKDTFKSAAK